MKLEINFNHDYVRKHIIQGYPDKLQKLIKEIFDALEDEYTEDNLLTRFSFLQEFIRDEMLRRMYEIHLKYGCDQTAYESNIKSIVNDVYSKRGSK